MKKTKLLRIVFEPDGAEVFVPAGTLLSKAAAASGRAVESPCGGMGTCGKCKVFVSGAVGEPDLIERRLLGDDEIASGARLACRTRVTGDISVTIPEESRSRVQKILSRGTLRDVDIVSGIKKVYCELPPPSLTDETAEFERLAGYMRPAGVRLRPSLCTLRGLSRVMKSADYKVTAVLYGDELIGIEPGDTRGKAYGIAYDLGSTTIVGFLMDLETGKELAVSAVMNPQTLYGDDLVSRISFATTQEDGASVLQSAAVDALNRIAESLAQGADVALENIYKVTVVGNTCMTHLLLGIDTLSLGQSPYVPSVCADIITSARDLSLNVACDARVVVLPNVAGFVGSDLVGVLLAHSWERDGRSRLAVDIGTNGEMALLHNEKTYVCSAAAGPAFEGAGISQGMRASAGAIDSVKIRDDVEITTIENRRPIGICGSGLVDAIAQMLDAGLIDETGRLLPPDEAGSLPAAVRERLIQGESGPEFVLATRAEAGGGKQVTVTSSDVRRLQLAKGSIRAAIQTLLHTAGAEESDLEEVLLAGAFGNYIRIESAIRIGLIPGIDRDRVKSVGNAAGAGSRLALLSEKEMDVARHLARHADHIELGASPDYQMELMDKMMFPALGSSPVVT